MDMSKINYSYWVLQTIAMLLTCALIPNLKITGPLGAFFMVLGIAFVNSWIWDAALFYNIPNTITSQTLILLFSNGIIFWILVKLLPGIEIQGVLPAFFAPLIFTGFSLLISNYLQDVDWLQVGSICMGWIASLRDSLLGGMRGG